MDPLEKYADEILRGFINRVLVGLDGSDESERIFLLWSKALTESDYGCLKHWDKLVPYIKFPI